MINTVHLTTISNQGGIFLDKYTLERERRFSLMNTLMDRENLDALVFTSSAVQTDEVAIKYLTNTGLLARRAFAFLKKNEIPYFILATQDEYVNAKSTSWIPYDHILLGDPVKEAVQMVTSLGSGKRVGIYEPNSLPILIHNELFQADAEFVDITAPMTVLRAPKSSFEIDLIQQASDLAVHSMDYILEHIRPGITERELLAGADGYLIANGAQELLVMCVSEGQHSFIHKPKNVAVKDDGVLVYSCEFSGSGGYWTQLARAIFMKRGCEPEVYQLYQAAKAAIQRGAELLRPGNRVCDINNAVLGYIKAAGYSAGHWAGHAMGADLGDGMPITSECQVEIRENMVFTLHPNVVSGEKGIFYGDTYLVTSNGAINLTAAYNESPYLEDMLQELSNRKQMQEPK